MMTTHAEHCVVTPIDLTREQLLGLTDAARALPAIDGKRVHCSTIWRWCRNGVNGVTLEHVRLGHRVCTSMQALTRFSQRLAEVSARPPVRAGGNDLTESAKPRSAAQRDRDIAEAEAELGREGI